MIIPDLDIDILPLMTNELTGFGLKIPADIYEKHPDLVQIFLAYMSKYHNRDYPHYVGYDDTYINTKEGKHYHLHWIGSYKGSFKTVQNFKNKFHIKDSKMKFYTFDGDKFHIYKWFAYAIKENQIMFQNGLKYECNPDVLEVYRKAALEKKKKKWELENKKKQEKDIKKELYDSLVEYFEKYCYREFQIPVDHAQPSHLRMLIIKYYRDELKVPPPRRQDLVSWQNRYFSGKWTLEEIDQLIMGRY